MDAAAAAPPPSGAAAAALHLEPNVQGLLAPSQPKVGCSSRVSRLSWRACYAATMASYLLYSACLALRCICCTLGGAAHRPAPDCEVTRGL